MPVNESNGAQHAVAGIAPGNPKVLEATPCVVQTLGFTSSERTIPRLALYLGKPLVSCQDPCCSHTSMFALIFVKSVKDTIHFFWFLGVGASDFDGLMTQQWVDAQRRSQN